MGRRRFLPGLRGLATKQWGTWAGPTGVFSPVTDAMRRAWPFERAVAEGFERTVWVYKSVDAIAGNQSRLDFVLRDGDEVITDHPLCLLLNDGKANPLESGRQFRKRLSQQILLSPGGAFVEVTMSNGGTPKRLDLLPPSRTRPVPGRGGDLLSHFETIAPDGRRHMIDPEKVRWFRDPHPSDPFRGITPLEAAGLSVDLDYLSRLYNVVFIRNDGRPATLISIEGPGQGMSPGEAQRVESRFGRGPMEAGKATVINGKVRVDDLGARPRDMAYGETATRAKEEVLAAFGVGESLLGNAAQRTFDNSEQEFYNFWTITMPPHNGIVTSGFDPDSDEGLVGELDTSKVEVLRRVAAARRAEAREEAGAGLISLDEYRTVAEYEPIDLPHTRALYIPTGKTPIPGREEDAVALGLATDEAAPGAPASGQGGLPPGQTTPAEGEGEQPGRGPAGPGVAGALTRLQSLLDADTAGTTGSDPGGDAGGGGGEAGVKALPARLPDPAAEGGPDPRDQLETKLGEVLDKLADRLVSRTAARAVGPKARKGTRHFQPQPGFEVDTRVGDAPLDVSRIIDPEQWGQEAAQVVAPLIEEGAAAAATLLLPRNPSEAAAGAGEAAAGAAGWVAAGVRAAAVEIGEQIAALDAAGADMDAIVGAVRDALPGRKAWARRAALAVATHVVHAVEAEAAARVAGPSGLAMAEWKTRHDPAAGRAHQHVDGQVQPAGRLFQVGQARLRWPGDLAAGEAVSGCRCRLRWTVVPGADAPSGASPAAGGT